jgi:hypothetical protein
VSRNYPDDVRDADFDDAPDYLHDKPEGFCPYCGQRLKGRLEGGEYLKDCPDWLCRYDGGETEAKNREKYAKEREQDAKTETRINRELSRRSV